MSDTRTPGEKPEGDDEPLSEQDDASLVAAIHRDVDKSDSRQQEWRKQAAEDFAYVAGNQWSDEDEAKLREQGRPPITFNRLGVLIDAVCGAQLNNRQEMKFLPRTMDDQSKADIVQGVVNWARDDCDAEDAESDAFRDMAICGMGWLSNRPDYSEDPSGKIVKDRVSPLAMRWDPAAKKRNLVDARWKAEVKALPADEVEAVWPGALSVMTNALGPGSSIPSVVLPQRDRYAQHEDGNASDDGTVEVIEYQWRETERIWAVSGDTGQAIYMEEDEYKAFREARESDGKPMPKVVALGRAKWFRAVICGDILLERGECADPQDSTYQCMTGKRDEASGTFYGLIRNLRDPQMWANKWLSQSLHILNTSAKSGVWVETGAVEDMRKLEENYARTGAVLEVSPGAISSGRIKDRDAPAMPAGFYQLLQFAIMSIPDVSGVSREALGLADREQAGILEAQRKQSSQAVMAPYFDALRLYYKRDGRQIARLVAAYIPPDKQIRVVMGDQQDPMLVTTAMLPDVAEFDIIVDEAPSSPNQKSEMWQFIGPALPGLIGKVPMTVIVEFLRFSPLPESGIARLESLAQNYEQQQSQQPNPEMMKLQAQQQADQQKLAFEAQKAQQDMAMREREMALEAQKTQAELEFKEREMALQIAMKEREAQIKLAEADHQAQLRERDSAREYEKAMRDGEREDARFMREIETKASERAEVAEVLKPISEITEAQRQMREALSSLTSQMKQVSDDISAPRELIRDPKTGRAMGVKVGSRVRQITRGPDGRAAGLQ